MVDYGMVHHDLCRELFTLRIRTEKKLLFIYMDFFNTVRMAGF